MPNFDIYNPWQMAGTMKQYGYNVIAASKYARVGFKDLGGSVRVRVEPIDEHLVPAVQKILPGFSGNWAAPESGNLRFSQVISKGDDALAVIENIVNKLSPHGGFTVNPNLDGDAWKDLVRDYSEGVDEDEGYDEDNDDDDSGVTADAVAQVLISEANALAAKLRALRGK